MAACSDCGGFNRAGCDEDYLKFSPKPIIPGQHLNDLLYT